MEDYMRGILCGYLTVQHGVKDDAKKTRMFLVLTDSRMDYYATDPRPEFEQDIADAHIFTPATRVHFYVEINAKAPPFSICLTADKATHVYIADSDEDAQTWYRHLQERLDALATMVTGTLVLRKEISVNQQFKRMLLKTKYKWKTRYIELGRSSLRFCKEPDRKTKMMKQFTLSAQSFVSEEGVEFLKQRRVFASYATAIQPDAKMLSRFKKETREQQYNKNDNNPQIQQQKPIKLTSSVAAAYPFVVATGQAHLYLAAPTESARADWVMAIKMRIISLKYRHNGDKKKDKEADGYQLRGFMEVQMKPGGDWKKQFVELDNDIVRVKVSERKIGSRFETRLLPTCHVAPTLVKANAFVLRSLGKEISLAPGSMKEAERWMTTLMRAGKATSLMKYQKFFEEDVRALLKHSVVYNLAVPAGEQVGLVVERYKKRIVVLSHSPPQGEPGSLDSRTGSFTQILALKRAKSSIASSQIIPHGSVLVAISQFEIVHESFENIWHKLRHKKGYQHPMTLTFRVPAMKQGLAAVRFRVRDPWVGCRCTLQHGKLSIASVDKKSSETVNHKILADLPIRHCQVELVGEEDCPNGIKITVTGTNSSALVTTLLLNIADDHDCFLWFALLHLETAVAQDDFRYPLSIAALVNSKNPPKRSSSQLVGVAEDQKRCFQQCPVVGMRVEEIEKAAVMKDPLARMQASGNGGGDPHGGINSEAVQIIIGNGTTSAARQLSESDVAAFFQHLDAIGCGKITSTGLVRTMEALTRHIEQREETPDTMSVGAENSVGDKPKGGGRKVLTAFHAALDALSVSADKKENGSFSISMSEFLTLMKNVTDAEVVDLVQKMTRHDIQCM